MQKSLVKLLIDNFKVKIPLIAGSSNGIFSLSETQKALLNIEMLHKQEGNKFENISNSMLSTELYDQFSEQEDVNGFGFLQRFIYLTPDIAHIYYEWLLQNKDILEKLLITQKRDIKLEYQY